MKKKYWLAAAAAAVLFTLTGAMTALAANQRIETIQISIDDAGDLSAGKPISSVSASTNSTEYYIDNAQFINGGDTWVGGTTPQIEVDLIAADGYEFPSSFSKSDYTITSNGYDAKYKNGKRDSSDRTYFAVFITLRRVSGNLSDTQDLYWDDYTANWTHVPGADRYEVRLYRGSSLITTARTDSDYYDFGSRMTTKGYYRFRVRALADNEALSTWSSYSDDIYIDADEARYNRDYESEFDDYYDDHYNHTYSGGPGTIGYYNPNYPGITPANGNRWVSTSRGWRYQFGNGTYAYNGWQQINGQYYFFDSSGYMMTGWLRLDNGWYYLDVNSGAMQTGWELVNGKWYYMDSNGLMQVGWRNINNKWYYLNLDGAMVTGWNYINDRWYYMDESGAMQSNGWFQINGKMYYLDSNGAMYANAFTPDGHYVDSSGAMVW